MMKRHVSRTLNLLQMKSLSVVKKTSKQCPGCGMVRKLRRLG